jgi:hypothetical protein
MPTFENYEAFLHGINNQLNVQNGSVDPSDTSPADPAHLLSHHLDLLVNLQQALAARAHSPAEALTAWELIHSTLAGEAEAAKSVVDNDTVATVERQIAEASQNFVGAAYHAAERAAEGRLEAPDLEEQKVHLERAEQELLEANKLWESASKVMASGIDKALDIKETNEIIELVKLPGTIQEKMEKARQKGIITQVGTAVELVGKIKGGTAALLKVTARTGERYCAGVARLAASQGNKLLLKEVEETAEQWKWLSETAETLGTVASVISLIGDGISLVDSIREGNWEEAAAQAADMAVDAAPLLLGAEVAAPLAGAVVLVKAEMQAIHDAAAFIRYCKDEQVRVATGNFVKGLTDHVYPWATKLAADVDVMLDPTQPEPVQRAAMDMVNEDATYTWQGVKFVAGTYLGPLAQLAGNVYASMGREAYEVFSEGDLSMPAETKEGVIALAVVDKVAKIFHGANLMAKYVHEYYTN